MEGVDSGVDQPRAGGSEGKDRVVDVQGGKCVLGGGAAGCGVGAPGFAVIGVWPWSWETFAGWLLSSWRPLLKGLIFQERKGLAQVHIGNRAVFEPGSL